jgi:hypothetical protein
MPTAGRLAEQWTAAIASLLTEVGLHPIGSGSVGITSLQYVLAAPSA